ncbi:MAG: hypothetical protein E7463_06110 [Ruminococcaceae bacterium]|nr:hypothetical protein [Oscillospiraceae bacterium]
MDTTRHEVLAKFRDLPVIEAHAHFTQPHGLKESVGIFEEIRQMRNYETFGFMAASMLGSGWTDPFANEKAAFYKKQFPGSFAFGTLIHDDTASGYEEQAKRIMAMGLDGIKMLEGKPDLHRRIGRGVDDPIYDRYYAYLEENAIPITMHVGDPASFWDPELAPPVARERGWFYGDPSFPARERLYIEIWNLMEKFPDLHLTLAHFGFFGHIPQMAEEFLSRWKNTGLDLTPGGIMYAGFSSMPEFWKDFFVRHQDRIIFGTDCYNIPEREMTHQGGPSGRWELVRSFLEFTEPFEWDGFDKPLIPFGFDDDILLKLYNSNPRNFMGGTPRELDEERINWSVLEI